MVYVSENWTCKACIRKAEGGDQMLDYVRYLVHSGLGHQVRRDAIRRNDGPGLIIYRKLDMLVYWRNNHKYLAMGHRLFAGKNINNEYNLKSYNSSLKKQ